MEKPEEQWLPFLQRYEQSEWRAPIFRDMILINKKKLARTNSKITMLDIG